MSAPGGGSALVTGAASGIGKVLAETLAGDGSYTRWTLIDLDGAALMDVRDALLAAHPGLDVLVVAADVTNAAAMARTFEEHLARHGSLDLVLLCAGIGERGDFLAAGPSTASLERTLEVDLTAVIAATRDAARAMVQQQRGGRIISIASSAGIYPIPASPFYCAAKGGLVHFTRSLAPRLAEHSIQLATVCPQFVDTPLVANMLQKQPDVARAMMGPLFGQPLLSPQQVVAVVQRLLAQPLPQRGRAVPYREVMAGTGSVWVLAQNGRVLDPFAKRPQQQQRQGRGDAGSGRSSGGGSTVSSSPLAAASAASMARFSDAAALAAFAAQPAPGSYRKLQVASLSPDFRRAVRCVSVPLPGAAQLGPGQLLVRRCFVGINASDINFTSGRYHGSAKAAQAALPYDAGFESVGVVVGAAPDVATAFPVGSAVATMEGGFSEWGVVASRRALPVPCPAPEVVALLTSGLTASLALEEVGGLALPGGSRQPQQQTKVLVTAAAGGTGQFAVQLAKLAGAHVIATCGGAAKAQLLRQLGVDRVIDYKAESVKEVLKREYAGGVDVVYESVGGEMFDLCVDALAPRGRLIIIGMMSRYSSGWQPSTSVGLPEKLLWKSASVSGFFLLRYAPQWSAHLRRLCDLVAAGRLAVVLDSQRFVGLDAVPAAVDRLQSGASIGKVIVQLAQRLPAAAGARL